MGNCALLLVAYGRGWIQLVYLVLQCLKVASDPESTHNLLPSRRAKPLACRIQHACIAKILSKYTRITECQSEHQGIKTNRKLTLY